MESIMAIQEEQEVLKCIKLGFKTTKGKIGEVMFQLIQGKVDVLHSFIENKYKISLLI
jgi:hypothetical protein